MGFVIRVGEDVKIRADGHGYSVLVRREVKSGERAGEIDWVSEAHYGVLDAAVTDAIRVVAERRMDGKEVELREALEEYRRTAGDVWRVVAEARGRGKEFKSYGA